jgi:23S rRNA pseudouridine2605 synthase
MNQSSSRSGERLQKVLANAGMGSRRQIEGWIVEGRVEVNGVAAELGRRINPEDIIYVDGKRVPKRLLEAPVREVIVYNKPEGELVTRKDPEGRHTVFERMPKLKHGRWIPVGRLDINSSGLLLLTTDGELANQLMHPSRQVEREYAVRVMGEITGEQLKTLTNGVELEDGSARFEEIVESGGEGINRWFHVVIMEGRQREVRRMWEAVGARVSRLKRVRYGSVILESALKVGHWRHLTEQEINDLLVNMGHSVTRRAKPHRNKPARPGQRDRKGAKSVQSQQSKGRARATPGRKKESGKSPATGNDTIWKGKRGGARRSK